jgi:protein tyrosine phosphatase (PTP) superfamily phosphohydrolase (DUF442 family)
MQKPIVFWTLVIPVTLVGLEGCCTPCPRRPACAPCGPAPCATALPPGAVPFVPPPPPSFPQGSPAVAPLAPGSFPQGPPGVPPPPAPPPAPAPVAPEVRGFGPAASNETYNWQPGDNNVRLEPPVAPGPDSSNAGARLLPPETSASQAASAPAPAPAPAATETRTPPANPELADKRLPSRLPVGIAQFAVVKDKVASGARPLLDDGLDWLQANGYRTVLHLMTPGEDDAADRKQVEKRGLKYLSLEVSPETLTRKTVEDFSRAVGDAAGYPLFVYDRDGTLAGGLWYLHFRLTEQIPDDTARVRASSLGLREDREGARAMWLAMQKLLSEP